MTTITRIRLALSLSGMVLAVVAIMTNDRRIVWGAVALLAASLILRLVQRNRPPGGGPSQL
jgi:hypothetical protein